MNLPKKACKDFVRLFSHVLYSAMVWFAGVLLDVLFGIDPDTPSSRRFQFLSLRDVQYTANFLNNLSEVQ